MTPLIYVNLMTGSRVLVMSRTVVSVDPETFGKVLVLYTHCDDRTRHNTWLTCSVESFDSFYKTFDV